MIIRIKESSTPAIDKSFSSFNLVDLDRENDGTHKDDGRRDEREGWRNDELPCQLFYEGVSLASIYRTFYPYLRRSFSLFLLLFVPSSLAVLLMPLTAVPATDEE